MKTTKGFTLIELMVTIAVLGILLSIAVPSFNAFVRNNRMVTSTNEVVTALALARTEAIKRGAQVMVNATGGSWANGITVELADGTDVRLFPAPRGGTTVTEAGGITSFGFEGSGLTSLPIGSTVTFQLCDAELSGESGRQISLTRTGRVTTTNIVCP